MASRAHGLRLAKHLVDFALANKKWWLIPMVVVSLLLVGLVALSSTPVAPFVYTLF
ncbi:MAG: DUF5989 family protein [Polyangiales bacterium]